MSEASTSEPSLPPRKPGARLRTAGLVLSIVGLIWCLPAVVPVVHDIYILNHADRYSPATLVVDEVRFDPPGGGDATFEGRGVIEGDEVTVPLHEFVGISSGLLSMFTTGYDLPGSLEEAEEMVPPGTSLEIHYWPEGPDTTVGVINLRAFRFRPDFPGSFLSDLLLRDLPLCVGPLLAGLILWFAGRRIGRRSADAPGFNV